MKQNLAYPSTMFMRLFARMVFFFFTRYYGIKGRVPPEVKKLKPPYLLLSNHAGYWDPFIAGYFLPHFVHFVSSDAAFKNRFQNFFMSRLGAIPKKKNIRDTKVIRDIATVIKQGRSVGIFPAGSRTWAGQSLNFDPSVIKLIRMLNVPVVCCVLKGMSLFNPRWSRKIRRTRVEAEYKLFIQPQDLRKFQDQELYVQLNNALFHDDIAWQKLKKNKIYSEKRAEYVNHALFVCPECHAIDSFRAAGNNFVCISCKYDIHINKYGFYERLTKGKLYFDNMLTWYEWQKQWLHDLMVQKIGTAYTGQIFGDKASLVYREEQDTGFKLMGQADLNLFINRIEIDFRGSTEKIVMSFDDLQTINPQVSEMLEIFYQGEAYRIIGGHKGVSALKWEIAANAIWEKSGQTNKLSAYLK
jgi:1-acyl-sn-glycerol-3-phosphate acyltransferase